MLTLAGVGAELWQEIDALQLAAAIASGATLFVTNDRRLGSVRETRVLLLEDYITPDLEG